MTDSQIIALFWERNEDAIQETDAVYGRKLYAISDKILRSTQDAEERKKEWLSYGKVDTV